ncbi:hypothetical protein MPTK1_1g27220 [Marchantia polymorpha subsp. ruderalis]|uniref:Uncharacterized protein n=2 Tax=Marchantia polymorpha TaxID=3197 RepID=A0A176VYR9_MARPO|nr:hypothetical protein AXG93_1712s1280 [Marchantia polymorpha subsp. ruderalis]PTQ49681.1 hypothetical protein MARPO_0002s0156 [Marchantia polymorpha]PTQ49682.1 hypothetical protein MARPO_0002s0156 [Marchantia polymorpha]PTQ49683.1 hypothetical protein MARPO_0002s0156 [Marchantia polymorpha]BBN00201.1 hypothetical protein Mp_1g27220 [Marchantia polymorpha subsp. ruderalis]|eukprot:PTQ49681.1 hypothetical protein MARPO_0002s0156 [Marchantia polymorpha]
MKHHEHTLRLSRTACQLWMLMTTIAIFSATLYLMNMLRDSEIANGCFLSQLQSSPLKKISPKNDVVPQPAKNETLEKPKTVEIRKQNIKFMPHDKASILRQYLENGSTLCHHVPTARAHVFGLPHPAKGDITLTTDEDHDLLIVSYAENGQRRCSGGDFYETDLTGTQWKARPPVQDLGDGTYLVKLRVDSRFPGSYQLKVILLFANLHGLDRSPDKWAMYNMTLEEPTLLVTVKFLNEPSPVMSTAAEFPPCSKKDFDHTSWQGRWTRTKMNETCNPDNHGRFKCLPANESCDSPWCTGPVGSLESDGWAYSTHCAFRIFTRDEAWSCLKDKWLFFWGDSNHQDTARNLLNFILGFDLASLPRTSDQNYTNPENPSETVRISLVFNGHYDDRYNYKGLLSLQNATYRERLRSNFDHHTDSEGKIPDAMILNSGLHDGIFWSNFTHFVEAAENASSFWHSTWAAADKDVHKRPKVVYRTTVAPAGAHRITAINPQKVELMNTVLVDSFVSKFGLENLQIVDDFDMTFPWHYDKSYSDGEHYGRAPNAHSWIKGGHHYFVDLMLAHVHLNAICPL